MNKARSALDARLNDALWPVAADESVNVLKLKVIYYIKITYTFNCLKSFSIRAQAQQTKLKAIHNEK